MRRDGVTMGQLSLPETAIMRWPIQIQLLVPMLCVVLFAIVLASPPRPTGEASMRGRMNSTTSAAWSPRWPRPPSRSPTASSSR